MPSNQVNNFMLLHLGTIIFVSHISIFWVQADSLSSFRSPLNIKSTGVKLNTDKS